MYIGVHRHARSFNDDDEHECAETIAISEKFEHEAYNDSSLTNDIALLRLSSPPTCSLSSAPGPRPLDPPLPSLLPCPSASPPPSAKPSAKPQSEL